MPVIEETMTTEPWPLVRRCGSPARISSAAWPVQAVQAAGDGLDRPAQRRGVGDVRGRGGDGDVVLAQLRRRGGQAFLVAGDQADRGTLGGQRRGHGQPDAPASAGDEHTVATQAQVHRWTPFTKNPTVTPGSVQTGSRWRGLRVVCGPNTVCIFCRQDSRNYTR
jgi:hypothetical protein